MTNACIQWLLQYRESWVGWLQREKEQLAETIETAIQEAESCAAQGFIPATPLAQAILSAEPEKLRVIRCRLRQPDLQSLSKSWIIYENDLQTLCERISKGNKPVNPFDITEEIMAAFHRFSEDTHEIPVTISRHRLPTEHYWHDEKAGRMLSQSYPAWRQSARDGNSFYRCLAVLLLEHYCRPDTPLSEFQDFLYGIQTRAKKEHISKVFSYLKKWELFDHLHQLRKNGENALQILQYYLSQPTIDTGLIDTFRGYLSENSFLGLHIGHHNDLYSRIRQNGNDGEEVVIRAAACSFSLIIHIFDIWTSSATPVTDTIFGPDKPGVYPSLAMLHNEGNFSCLIRSDVHYVDRYDFTTNTYSPYASGQPVEYEQYPGTAIQSSWPEYLVLSKPFIERPRSEHVAHRNPNYQYP